MYKFYIPLLVGVSAVTEEETVLSSRNRVCLLPKKVGPCEALIPRYFYNIGTKRCERFSYGGCQGNANNFEAIEECEKTCGGRGNQSFPFNET